MRILVGGPCFSIGMHCINNSYHLFLLQVPAMDGLLNRIKALEDKQKPSVGSLKKAIVQYGLRQPSDFDKYKMLELVEQLKNVAQQIKDKKADYFATVYATLQERIHTSPEQFRLYVLSLLGDRDYDKVVESIAKVDKAFCKDITPLPGASSSFSSLLGIPGHTASPLYAPRPPPSSFLPHPAPYHPYSFPTGHQGYQGTGSGGYVTCYACGLRGHYARNCIMANRGIGPRPLIPRAYARRNLPKRGGNHQ